MNTIKIYLAESGRIAELKKDFPLYQGQFQNKLLNVYVPTSIIAPEFTPSIADTSVKIGCEATARNGTKFTSKAYYMRYLKKIVYQNVEYAMYEKKLPKEFTMFAGQGNNATVIIANVVNIDNSSIPATIISITTSQTCSLDVMPSTILDRDEEILNPSELEQISGIINGHTEQINNLNDGLKATNNQVETNRQGIATNLTNITSNSERITNLESQALTGLNFIGIYPSNEVLPNENQLTQFVYDNTVPNRAPKSGDFIKFTQIIPNDTDKNFTRYFGNKVWGEWVEELPVEKADNENYGIVKGTATEDKETRVDIRGGVVESIQTKDYDGTYRNVATRLNTIETTQNEVLDGTKAVGLANKAIADQNGSVINKTYAQANDVYTKAEADKRYLSALTTDILHYSNKGIVDDTPTEPADEKQFEKTVSTVGNHELFKIEKVLDARLNLNKNTSDKSNIWISANRDCSLNFRLTTYGRKGEDEKLLNAELTGEMQIIGGTFNALNITSIYNALGNEEYVLESGDAIIKKLEFITKDSQPTTVAMFSGFVHDSTVNLVGQSIDFNVNSINGKKKINILANEWTDNEDGTFSVTITQVRHEQAPSNQYGLDLQKRLTANSVERIAFTPIISDDGDITITSYEAIDCELLVWSAIQSSEKGIVKYTNPTTITNIDYTQIGAITIIQTNEPSALTLPLPKNVSQYYSVFVSNDKTSTKEIKIENNTVEIGNGLKFKWNGNDWQLDDMPDKTSEMTDDYNNRPLNDTLKDYNQKIMSNFDEVNMVASDLTDLTTEVGLKANSKSVELKEGLPVDNLVDFYKYFYDLRKGIDDTWEIEVGKGKNENIMKIFGFPYGESASNSAELIIKRKATSGIGYTLEIIFASEKSNTTHTAFVRGWITSGTSYDRYIHFTGWRNARGGQWVDEVNGEVTLTDTNEIVLDIGEFKNPYNNFLIAEVTKNNHSYNAFLMLSITSKNVGETTIKLDNEDVYVKVDYNAKTFTMSKTSSGTETLKVHLYEKLI